jgi:hypothetical protein
MSEPAPDEAPPPFSVVTYHDADGNEIPDPEFRTGGGMVSFNLPTFTSEPDDPVAIYMAEQFAELSITALAKNPELGWFIRPSSFDANGNPACWELNAHILEPGEDHDPDLAGKLINDVRNLAVKVAEIQKLKAEYAKYSRAERRRRMKPKHHKPVRNPKRRAS